VEDLADWGTSNEEGRRLYALAVTKKNVTSNAARIACLWCVGSKSHSNDSYLVAVVDPAVIHLPSMYYNDRMMRSRQSQFLVTKFEDAAMTVAIFG
jgi:hypothetical protein